VTSIKDLVFPLPRTTGVYIFRGLGELPLYIGKSVDIRSRVQAHFRADNETEMMSQTMRIDFIETAGEIGALLLESQLIKQQTPLFNIRLRRIRNLYSIQLRSDAKGLIPEFVTGKDLLAETVDELYGLFSSRHSAQAKLRELSDQYRLCAGLLGLEKLSARGCFGLQVKTCLGACVGLEDRAVHDARWKSALADMKVHAWPFHGMVELIEQKGAWIQRHRIQNWRYLGTQCSHSKPYPVSVQKFFDLDTYKILVKPIMLGQARIEFAESGLNEVN